jgi:hypothetical protein
MVQRTTIVISEDLHAKLRRIAAERGMSFAALLREAAEEKVRESRRAPRNLGMGKSGQTDIARRASELYEPDEWRSS